MTGDPFEDVFGDGFDDDLVESDERLADYVDDRLGERERERFEAELRVSPRLREQLEHYQRTVAMVQQALRAPTQSTQLADRVMAALASEAARPSLLRRKLRPFLFAAASAAALLTLALVVDRLGAPEPSQRSDFVSTPTTGDAGAVDGAPLDTSKPEPADGSPALTELLANDELPAPGVVADVGGEEAEMLRLEGAVEGSPSAVAPTAAAPSLGSAGGGERSPADGSRELDHDKAAKSGDGSRARGRRGAPPTERSQDPGSQEWAKGEALDDRAAGERKADREVADHAEHEQRPLAPGGGGGGAAGPSTGGPSTGGPGGPSTAGPGNRSANGPLTGGARGPTAPGAPQPSSARGGEAQGGLQHEFGAHGERRDGDALEAEGEAERVAARKVVVGGGAKSAALPITEGQAKVQEQPGRAELPVPELDGAPAPKPGMGSAQPAGDAPTVRFAARGERARRLPMVVLTLPTAVGQQAEPRLREKATGESLGRSAAERRDSKDATPDAGGAADLLAGFVVGELSALEAEVMGEQVDNFFVSAPTKSLRLAGLQLQPLLAAPRDPSAAADDAADAVTRDWLVSGSQAELERLMRAVARLASAHDGRLSTGEVGVVDDSASAPPADPTADPTADPAGAPAEAPRAIGPDATDDRAASAGSPRRVVLRFRRR